MDTRDIQEVVEEFNNKHGLNMNPLARGLDLSSEIGEVQKELLIGSNYGSSTHSNTDNLIYEMGDSLYALLSLANETGLDLKTCLYLSLEKMSNRFASNNNK